MEGPLRHCVIIGDVHAEDERLAAVLRWAVADAPDAIICTGDVVDGRGSASRCCGLLQDHEVLCVRGNHDRWLFSGVLRDQPGATQLADLPPDHQEFLRTLPATRDLETTLGAAIVCHGLGASDLEKITEFDTDYSLKVNRALQAVVAAGRYRIMFNGHSHCRMVRMVNGLAVVNAGTLCHPDDPGFLRIDCEQNEVQWYSLRNGTIVLAEQRSLI